MSPGERLQRYLECQIALLDAFGELQGKIQQSTRAGEVELLAAQAMRARELASELTALVRAARPLAAWSGGERARELEARVAERRNAALRANRGARTELDSALRELSGRIRDLAARPRTPPSPFARIGRPMLVDLSS